MIIGTGWRYGSGAKMMMIDLDESVRQSHMITIGEDYSAVLELSLKADIESGKSVIVLADDVGGKVFGSLIETAVKARRTDDLMLLSTRSPELSAQVNPFSGMTESAEYANFFSRLDAGLRGKCRTTPLNIANQYVKCAFVMAQVDNIAHDFRLCDIADLIMEGEYSVLMKDIDSLGTPDARHTAKRMGLLYEEHAECCFASAIKALRDYLGHLHQTGVYDVIGTASGNRLIERLDTGGVICMVDGCKTICETVCGIIHAATNRRAKAGGEPGPFAAYFIGKGPVNSWLPELLRTGKTGLELTLFFSSLLELYDAVGTNSVRDIMTSIGTRVFMRSEDDITARHIVTAFHDYKKNQPFVMIDYAENPSLKTPSVDTLRALTPEEMYVFTPSAVYRGMLE